MAIDTFYAVMAANPTGRFYLDQTGFITGDPRLAKRFADVNAAEAAIATAQAAPGTGDWPWAAYHIHLRADGHAESHLW